jgi:hypothetical protein
LEAVSVKILDPYVNDVVVGCRKFAKQLGGDIVVVDKLTARFSEAGVFPCPFAYHTMAIDWHEKTVIVAQDLTADNISGLIHELGHVFASNKTPNGAKEFDFFGWEYVVAGKLGLLFQWSHGTRDYAIADVDVVGNAAGNSEWGALDAVRQDRLIRERLDHAIKTKLITKQLQPRSIRED